MDILDKIIWAESRGDPNAGAKTSSAVGLGQFTRKTWLDMMSRYRPDLTQGKSPAEILAMRTDPDLSRQMVGALVGEDTAALRRAGVPVTEGTTYLAHFAGAGKAIRLMKADPNTPVESVLDANAIDANPKVLKGKTVGDVIAWANQRMATAAAPKSSARQAVDPTLGVQTQETWSESRAQRKALLAGAHHCRRPTRLLPLLQHHSTNVSATGRLRPKRAHRRSQQQHFQARNQRLMEAILGLAFTNIRRRINLVLILAR